MTENENKREFLLKETLISSTGNPDFINVSIKTASALSECAHIGGIPYTDLKQRKLPLWLIQSTKKVLRLIYDSLTLIKLIFLIHCRSSLIRSLIYLPSSLKQALTT